MIPIRNIYHMLAYAFRILEEKGYADCGTEDFENTADLLSAILVKGVSAQIKRGLARDYVEVTEAMAFLRGRVDVTSSLKQGTLFKRQLVCTYDEYSENSYLSRVLKTTLLLLLSADIPQSRKRDVRRLCLYFGNVDALDVRSIDWKFRYNRSNRSYRLLTAVCRLIIDGLLQTATDGSTKLMQFLDDQRMCRLYERFILEYYVRHWPQIKTSASQVDWALDDDVDTWLPVMQSDIMLSYGDKTLIIDAKYYGQTLQSQYDAKTLHSSNLYQIFAYVKNKAATGGRVSGLLLYARTEAEEQPDVVYGMSGNRIAVKTLNLNQDFSGIKAQLDDIVGDFIG